MQSLKRFCAGAILGLVIIAIYWTTSSYFGIELSLIQGIFGSLLLVLACGLMTLKWGYQTLQTLLDQLYFS
jgi:hypothetical protein